MYFASRYDTVKNHSESNHGRYCKLEIYKVDHANWSHAREVIILPTRMPSLPLEEKVSYNKRGKENISPRKTSPRKVKIIELPTPSDSKMLTPIKTPVKISKIERSISTQTSPQKEKITRTISNVSTQISPQKITKTISNTSIQTSPKKEGKDPIAEQLVIDEKTM